MSRTLRRSLLATTLLAPLALWGCLPVSNPTDPDPEPEEQTQPEDGASLFAGKWKREDNGATFEVEDDGTTVTGSLVEGTYVWADGDEKGEEIFSKYEFELARKGGKLEGQATFVFKGEEDALKSNWVVTRSGDTLKAKVEEISFDDAGKESGRKQVEKTFAFEAAQAAVAAAPQAGAYKLDLTTMVQAPPLVMVGEDAQVGFKVEIETTAGGNTSKHTLAVVGEGEGVWHLETSQGMANYASMSPDAKDMLMGLVVEKDGGKVTKAVLGKRGEAGKEIKVVAYNAPPPGEAPEGEDVEVEVPAGTYPAKLYVTEVGGKTYKSWSGVEGDVEGVPLKTEGPQGGYALKEPPSMETLDLGESVEVKKCVYDNGDEWMWSDNEVIKSLAARMALMKTSASVMKVTMVATGAEAELKWE